MEMKYITLCLIISSLLFAPFVFASEIEGGDVAQVENIFLTITNWLFSFLVAGAVIGVVIGSYMILLSGGDPGKANNGKMIIIYALISVLVAAFSRGLVQFIKDLV